MDYGYAPVSITQRFLDHAVDAFRINGPSPGRCTCTSPRHPVLIYDDLRAARQAKNITLTAVAHRFGVWPGVISRIERGLQRQAGRGSTGTGLAPIRRESWSPTRDIDGQLSAPEAHIKVPYQQTQCSMTFSLGRCWSCSLNCRNCAPMWLRCWRIPSARSHDRS